MRVLDLTRVIAGPVATGFLAAHGAEVVRVDPVAFDEVPALVPVTTAGKRRCRLDLRAAGDRRRSRACSPGPTPSWPGCGPAPSTASATPTDRMRALNPGLVVVQHDAYGWTGPWAGRRGFDSLLQMSTGIAAPPAGDTRGGQWPARTAGRCGGHARPCPLPAQALDHATGYLGAAAVGRALTGRLDGRVATARLSLARTARLLVELGGGRRPPAGRALTDAEVDACLEPVTTTWGPARRVRWPGAIAGAAPVTGDAAGPLGSDPARWTPRAA